MWHLLHFNGWSLDFKNQHDISPLPIITAIKSIHNIPVNPLPVIIVIKSIHEIVQCFLHNYSWLNLFMPLPNILWYYTQQPHNNWSNRLIFILNSYLTKCNWWIDKSVWNFAQSMAVLLKCFAKFPRDSSTKRSLMDYWNFVKLLFKLTNHSEILHKAWQHTLWKISEGFFNKTWPRRPTWCYKICFRYILSQLALFVSRSRGPHTECFTFLLTVGWFARF